MYKIKYPHGIMFHHFHDNINHFKGQGSISASQFIKILRHIGLKNISNPKDFLKDIINKNKKVCLTFDDSLKCQFDIALPILKKYKIKAFFFIYTSIFEKDYEYMEVYRFFRDNYFKNIDEFYKIFFHIYENEKKILLNKYFKKKDKIIKKIKKNAPFYSLNDIKYRYLRDKKLNKKELHEIMLKIFRIKKININKIKKRLFLSKSDIKLLVSQGHAIGLHSHTHPYLLKNLSKFNQNQEYKKNKSILSKISNTKIFSMSHPCGSYNKDSIQILKKLNIDIGFKSSLIFDHKKKQINLSNLEIAREDHTNILKMIK